MPLDRAARDRLAAILAQYMRGEVDNFALDEVAMDAESDDDAVHAIGTGLWCTYDDFRRHTVRADHRVWETMRRTVAFLKTDLDLPQPKPKRRRWLHREQLWGVGAAAAIAAAALGAGRGSDLWWLLPGVAIGLPFTAWPHLLADNTDDQADRSYPFGDEAAWRAHEPLLAEERLPSFDAVVHDRPVRGRISSFMISLPASLTLAPLIALFMLIPRRTG